MMLIDFGGADVQENIRFNNQIQNANVAYAKLIPVIQMMAKRSDNWWSLRKRYGKLTENLIRGYILSRLRDIRLKVVRKLIRR